MRAQYEVLCSIVSQEYASLCLDIPEGIAVIRSEGISIAKQRTRAIALLDSWRRSAEINTLRLNPSTCSDKPATMAAAKNLLQLTHEFRFLLAEFERDQKRPRYASHRSWKNKGRKWREEILPLKLPNVEKGRFVRALCRLCLYTNIFRDWAPRLFLQQERQEERSEARRRSGQKEDEGQDTADFERYRSNDDDMNPNELLRERSEAQRVWMMFIGVIPPWEHDEMKTVWEWLYERFRDLLFCTLDKLASQYQKYEHKITSDTKRLRDIVPAEQNIDAREEPGLIDTALQPSPGETLGDYLAEFENDVRTHTGTLNLRMRGPRFVYMACAGRRLDLQRLVMKNLDKSRAIGTI